MIFFLQEGDTSSCSKRRDRRPLALSKAGFFRQPCFLHFQLHVDGLINIFIHTHVLSSLLRSITFDIYLESGKLTKHRIVCLFEYLLSSRDRLQHFQPTYHHRGILCPSHYVNTGQKTPRNCPTRRNDYILICCTLQNSMETDLSHLHRISAQTCMPSQPHHSRLYLLNRCSKQGISTTATTTLFQH
jgi:hypothetical protein